MATEIARFSKHIIVSFSYLDTLILMTLKGIMSLQEGSTFFFVLEAKQSQCFIDQTLAMPAMHGHEIFERLTLVLTSMALATSVALAASSF